MNPAEEIWKDIPSFPGYRASSLGRISGHCHKIMKQQRNRHGYLVVNISIAKWRSASHVGYQITVGVHILVCEAFNGAKPWPEALCLHWDDVKENNTPDNLRWGTAQDNMDDRLRNEALKNHRCFLGPPLTGPNI